MEIMKTFPFLHCLLISVSFWSVPACAVSISFLTANLSLVCGCSGFTKLWVCVLTGKTVSVRLKLLCYVCCTELLKGLGLGFKTHFTVF